MPARKHAHPQPVVPGTGMPVAGRCGSKPDDRRILIRDVAATGRVGASESACDSAHRARPGRGGMRAGCRICGNRLVRSELICGLMTGRSHCGR